MTVVESPETAVLNDASVVFPMSRVVPGNAGHPLDDAPLPYWLDRPCPPWCTMIRPHGDEMLADDRLHRGDCYDVELTQEPPDVFTFADGRVLSSEPFILMAVLYQHYKAASPHISLNIDAGTDVDLTLAEAGELAAALNAPGDDYVMITLTLEDADVDVAPKPWPEGREPEPVYWSRQVGVRLESAEEVAELGAPERRVVTVYRDRYLTFTPAEASDLGAAIVKLLAGAK